MGKVSEGDVIKSLDDLLGNLEDSGARDRVLHWAWEKYSTKPIPTEHEGKDDAGEHSSGRTKKAAKKKAKANNSDTKKKPTLLIEKDLNLKPKGKKSFDEFVGEKQPRANDEKCTVAVYYLRHELDEQQIGASHVYTCFKHMKWRIPTDLLNTLAWTASTKGWLDTKKMDDVKVTTIGENLVEHDLRARPKK